MPEMIRASIEKQIQFHDLDPMEIVWHGRYVKYFEEARTALLQQLNYDVVEMKNSGFSWPVIDLHVRYAKPISYQQRIRIEATLKEWEHRLKVEYRIFDVLTGQRLTKGHTVQVAVNLETEEMSLMSPEILSQKIKKYSENAS